jgi:hypothetical protein
MFFSQPGVISFSSNSLTRGPPFITCLLLYIWYIRIYSPYLLAVSSDCILRTPQPVVAYQVLKTRQPNTPLFLVSLCSRADYDFTRKREGNLDQWALNTVTWINQYMYGKGLRKFKQSEREICWNKCSLWKNIWIRFKQTLINDVIKEKKFSFFVYCLDFPVEGEVTGDVSGKFVASIIDKGDSRLLPKHRYASTRLYVVKF